MYELRQFFEPAVELGAGMSLRGVGVLEEMPRDSFVDRQATNDYLCVFFHDAARAGVESDRLSQSEKCLFIWGSKQHQCYGALQSVWCHSWLHIQGDAFPARLQALGIALNEVLPVGDLEAAFLDMLRGLFHESIEARSSPEILARILDIFLLRLSRCLNQSGQILPEYLRRAKARLDRDYAHAWTLPELAAHSGASVSHLSAAFSELLACPPMRYLTKVRMHQAALLLRNRNLRVGEVGRQVGYEDIYHFSKAFKQAHGLSPSAYLKRL
ncbi:helix-turn-helix transcriptional regulator [Coraliomargarita parva]|uniref:helix-turn-helix transcriptional regulator n=1 Tax=Coraliomargarita parva TaxID=3014050 RepID=UPI0022B4454E|nr:AraC family transcriptional regulator [Coraliomargarita parva]